MRPAQQHSRPWGGGSRQSRRRLFKQLEQEDQRLKKHYGRWMDIVQSLKLESFILTKLTKPSVPVILVGPQVSLPYGGSQLAGGIHFFGRNKEALPCVQRYSWWVRPVSGGGTFFREIQRPFLWVLAVRWRNHYFARNKEAFPCVQPLTQLSSSPRTVHLRCMSVVDHVDQATPRAPGRWTTARPRKGMTRSQGDSAVVSHAEGSTRVYWFVYHRGRITAGVGE